MSQSMDSKNTVGQPRVVQNEAKLIRQEEVADHREKDVMQESDFISLRMDVAVKHQNPRSISSSDCCIFDTVKSLQEETLSIELQREQMITRLKQIERMPFKSRAFDRTKLFLSCQIWVLTGIIDHGYPASKLHALADKYYRFGLIPTTYNLKPLVEENQDHPSNEPGSESK